MNYLAHIHLANLSNTSMEGNFLGDFVKGSNLSHLPVTIQQGVRLHRSIDTFTDNHPQVRRLKTLFPRELRRVSGICIDVFFDHMLCRHWQQFHHLELPHLLDDFYSQLEKSQLKVSPHYQQVKHGLIKHRWLLAYKNTQGVVSAFSSIEQRLSYKLIFAEAGCEFLSEHDEAIEQEFLTFYPDLINYVQHHPILFNPIE